MLLFIENIAGAIQFAQSVGAEAQTTTSNGDATPTKTTAASPSAACIKLAFTKVGNGVQDSILISNDNKIERDLKLVLKYILNHMLA